MAISKPTTVSSEAHDGTEVFGGPPAEGPTPTRAVGDPPPDTANLTDAGPNDPDEAVNFVSPWGTKFSVSKDDADRFKELGYKAKR